MIRPHATGFAGRLLSVATLLFAITSFSADLESEGGTVYEMAKNGDLKSQLDLANSYFYGRTGFKKDYSLAAYWYRKAAVSGSASAQFNLALCYDGGLGVERNEMEAFRHYKLSSEGGLPQAKYNVAVIYLLNNEYTF